MRGATVAVHRRAPDGAGRTIRDDGHVAALEQAALAAFTTSRPCTHKTRRPPSQAAMAEAAKLARLQGGLPATGPVSTAAAHVVIDLSTYAATAARLSTAPTYAPSYRQNDAPTDQEEPSVDQHLEPDPATWRPELRKVGAADE